MALCLIMTAFRMDAAIAQSAINPLLREITVTAQKRAQNTQEVGITLTVLDAQALKALNLSTLPEAAAFIPNVELFEDFAGAGIPTWVIRGVGLQDFNSNNTPTAAVYLDEIYQTSTVMGGSALFDVERLEVLKGPQGGLYGRNTSGGAVLLNTRRAELDVREGYVDIGYSRWENWTVEAAGNLPVSESLALRLSGRAEQSSDAWQTSLAGYRHHGEKDSWDMRAWLLYQPLDDLRIEWKAQGGRDDSEIPLGRSVGLYGSRGGFCQAVLEGRRDETCLSFAGLTGLMLGRPLPPVSSQAEDGSITLSDPLNSQANDYFGNALFITKTFAGADLVSITSLDSFNYGVVLDLDGSPGEYAHRFSSSDILVASQELRLVSSDAAPLDWLLGLTLSEERFEERRDFRFADNFLVVRTLGASQGRLEYDQDTSSAALYGSVDYAFAPSWSLNATLRYTHEEKDYRDGSLFVQDPPRFLARGLERDYRLEHPFSGKLGLQWQAMDDLMFYASASRGFKSGGFYGGFPISSPEEVSPYREETLNAFEAGFKSAWPEHDLGLNAALFYYDYRDVQGFITRQSALTGTAIDVLANPADAEHAGLDLEFSWRPSEAFALDLNVGYLDAAFKNARQLTANLEGDQVPLHGRRPYAPRWSGSLVANHQRMLGRDYRLSGTLSYHYRSDFSGELATPVEQALGRLPGYGLWNARLDIISISRDWSLSLWGENLHNESYLTRVKNDGLRGFIDLFGSPRRLGASLEYRW